MAARLVIWCWRHGAVVAAVVGALVLAAGWAAATRLGLDSDESHMLSPELPYRRAELRFDAAFPHTRDLLVAVLDADTPEQAEAAADGLVARLAGNPRFLAVERPAAEVFFRDHALLFLPEAELESLADRLIRAQPLLGGLAADPSARGLLGVLSLMAEGVRRGAVEAAALEPVVDKVAAAARSLATGTSASLSLRDMVMPGGGTDTRRLVLARPRLERASLVAGEAAASELRQAARGLPARLRLTGPVALSDDNFRTVAHGVAPTLALSLALVSALLLLAVGSMRVAGAILITLAAGLVLTAGFAALAVGVVNPLSVAFVVLFLGLAVDFCIQFALRFRDAHFRLGDAERAMAVCAAKAPRPLLVVALAMALGFLAFVPTDYLGVSQLGLIAGAGMVAGIGLTLTLLPALLGLMPPPPAKAPPGFAILAPVEARLRRHAGAVLLAAVAVAVVLALPAARVPVDFDPLRLQDPRAESVAALRDLAADTATSPYVVQALTASPAAAEMLARQLDGRRDIAFALTLSSFVPAGQDEKLAVIEDLGRLLGPSLHPPETAPPPDLAQVASALSATAAAWEQAGFPRQADSLREVVARGRVAAFARAVDGGVAPLLEQLRGLLAVGRVTEDDLPPALVRDWVGSGGEGRVEIHPAVAPADHAALAAFVDSVRSLDAALSGMPVAIVDSGRAVLHAFAQAGLTALAAAVALLAWVLRRPSHVVLVLAPLALGAAATLAAMTVLGGAVNFANIVAFPLLLGIGVACNVYFVLGWREGTAMLASATARAVLFSALTTGVSFGALALSPHRGTASLGLVLMVGLALMVGVSLLLLPAAFAWTERRR
ncbi:MAG: MMPL family transporter [Bacteroidota bacterium]